MIVYIGLGSNLDVPLIQLQNAISHINNHHQLTLLNISSLYQSQALTLPNTAQQNDYLNAVVKLETALSAEQLLRVLHNIEALQGRERVSKWAARTLDLDILLYGDYKINTEQLIIPHSQIAQRNFVIHPLFEIAGSITLPELGLLSDLATTTSWDGLKKLNRSLLL